MPYRYDLNVHRNTPVEYDGQSYYSDVTTDSEAIVESVTWARNLMATTFSGWTLTRLEVTPTLISVTELP